MGNAAKGCMLAALAGIFWALNSPISKFLGQRGSDMNSVVLVRLLVTALILGLWMLWRNRELFRIESRLLKVLLLFGPLGSVGVYLGFGLATAWLPVSLALVLFFTFPPMVTLFAWLLLKERPLRSDIISGSIVLVGVMVCAFTSSWTLDTRLSVPGILWGLLSALGNAGQTLIIRSAVKKQPSAGFTVMFYSQVIGVFWMIFWCLYHNSSIFTLDGADWMAGVAQALFPSIAACSVYTIALYFIAASTASLMSSMEIVAGVAMTALALGEWPNTPQVLGCCLVILAVVVAALGIRRQERQSARGLLLNDSHAIMKSQNFRG